MPHQERGLQGLPAFLIHLNIYLAHGPITSDAQGLYHDQWEQLRAFRLRYKDLPSGARIWLSVLFLKEGPSWVCSLKTSKKAVLSSQTQVLQLLLIQTGSGSQGMDSNSAPVQYRAQQIIGSHSWRPKERSGNKRSTSLILRLWQKTCSKKLGGEWTTFEIKGTFSSIQAVNLYLFIRVETIPDRY